MAFVDYFTPETLDGIRSKVKGYAVAAGLKITNWINGSTGQQTFEAFSQGLYNQALQTSALVRGYVSLDTSTDPGDVDPYDPTNAAMTPARGFLSEKGEGDFGTPRIDAAPATGLVTLTNASGGAVSFAPRALTFTRDTPFPGKSYNPTYRNSPDVTIYTNPDGTVTVANGSSLTFGVEAEVAGTDSNTTSGHLSLTTVIAPTGITITNGTIAGTGREEAGNYRTRCRQAAALTSPNGPSDSYRYLATSARSDGTWGTSTTGTPLGATRVYVPPASATGIAQIYIATASGKLSVGYTTIIAGIITTNPGVIAAPESMTILVGVQSGPDAGYGCSETTINVTYTVKGKAALVPGGASAGTYTTGGSPPDNVAAVFTAIGVNLSNYFASVPIGGNDQTAGTGVIYTVDIAVAIVTASIDNVALGLYDPVVSAPGTSSTAISAGHVGVLGTVTGTLILT